MQKTKLSIILLFVLFLLVINALIIETAYKAVFSFFKDIAPPPYFQVTTDILSVLLASLVLFTAIVIILERRDPAKTLAWLLILIFLPVVGFVLYLVTGRQFRKRRITSRKKKLNEFIFPMDSSYAENILTLHSMPPSKERLMQLILNNTDFPVTLYNDIDVLTNGDQIMPSMIEALEKAKIHIHLETYILRSDEIGTAIMEILLKKAAEGLDVRVICDGLGSGGLSDTFLESLREGGVDVRLFFPVNIPRLHSHINYRNHRKILVIDNTVGFLGGINIGDEYLGRDPVIGFWRDTHLRIHGNAVNFLNRIFLQDWYFLCGETIEELTPAALTHKPGKKLVQILSSGPDTHWAAIMQVYYYAIATAEKSIFLTSPYFIPNESILTALKTAALSGVAVKIILPANPDHKLLFWAAMSYLEELLDAGVEIYFYEKGFIHSKVLTIDGIISSVGSANMDLRSFSLNFEVNALIYDDEITQRLDDDFQKDLQDSEQLLPEDFKDRPISRRFLESLARLLSPLL